jgi:tetratricopeptide (TPR) repeat protein
LAFTGWNVTHSDALANAQRDYERGDVVRALAQAQDHLLKRPWSKDAALLSGRCLSRLDFAEDAEPYYRRAGSLSLGDLHQRAMGLMRGNHRERAIRAYEEILEGYPTDILALRRLAGIQITQSNEAAVMKLADRLTQIPQGAAIGYTLRGTVEHSRRNRLEAVAAYERVLEIDPELHVMPFPRQIFWSELASDMIGLGRLNDANEYLNRALAGEKDAPLMCVLGKVYDLQGDRTEAERCFRKAAEWEPKDYNPHVYFGRLALHDGRTDAALEHFEKAVSLAPRHVETLSHLEVAYRRLGRKAEAEAIQGRIDRLRARRSVAPRSPNVPPPSYSL